MANPRSLGVFPRFPRQTKINSPLESELLWKPHVAEDGIVCRLVVLEKHAHDLMGCAQMALSMGKSSN
jgi:hypothetical protein